MKIERSFITNMSDFAWLAHINKSIAHVFVNMRTFQKYAIHSYGLTIYSIDLSRTYPVSKFVF